MKIAFICTGNSARSQMAEGFAKYYAKKYGLDLEVYSAGSNPAKRIAPEAIKVMKEKGIDISAQYPKKLEDIPLNEMDLIITLCGGAKESCPTVPGARQEHWDLPDPAAYEGSEEERLEFFRKVRDEIEKRVIKLMEELKEKVKA
ncbi:arsenate reductase ArsC [Aquifex aeolicus]|uniref:Arsenate reductase n=1 Tax=Aquifex aeolicus (strain VF5) TaxID=224324 RepID=O66910_AQUAE|nr:arsenate reductase ArsC [Aquifex aeolicus]AAC06873.1 arsenate reductase [Aquifex aeolicus VF5]